MDKRIGLAIIFLFGAIPAWSMDVGRELFDAQELAWIRAHPVIRFAVDPAWRPVEFIENGVPQGLSIDYLRDVATTTGMRLELVKTASWAESVNAFNSGKVDILPGAFQELPGESLDSPLYSRTYYSGSSLIVARSMFPIVFDARRLAGRTIAVEQSGKYESWFRHRYPDVHLVSVPSEADATAAAARGQVDAAIVTDAIAYPLLRGRYENVLHIAGTLPDAPAMLRMAVHSQDALLVSIVNKSLANIDDIEAEKISDRWLNQADYVRPSFEALFRYFGIPIFLAIGLIIALVIAIYHARRARQVALASERQKNLFLATISHEIRTPIHAILAAVELLKQGMLQKQERRLIDVASSAAESLFKLLNDLLDYTRLQARAVQLECIASHGDLVAREAIDLVEASAREKQLDLLLHLPEGGMPTMMFDPTRVRQVLLNLLSNAIKFTGRGAVELSVNWYADMRGAWLVFTVQDTGIGIPDSAKKKLFEVFSQGEMSVTRRFGGTGLGLAICRELIDAMGGHIKLESVLDVGTVVRVDIPVLIVAQETVIGNPLSNRESVVPLSAHHHTPPILIVEDHASSRVVLEAQIQQLGLIGIAVEEGRTAITTFSAGTFSAVLLDCQLPDMDGYAVARQLRKIEQTREQPRTPILAISASIDSEHSERCRSSGMDAVLHKPIRLSELREALGQWLDHSTNLNDDGEMVIPTSERGWRIACVNSVREDILAARNALSKEAWERLAYHAHRIQGAARMIGDSVSAAQAAQIELVCSSRKKKDSQQIAQQLAGLDRAIADWVPNGDDVTEHSV
ncbi:transporter substrate-binding domain-containing protein [Burkholderia sp. MS455]|uniref:ATP-binding protein n=1 Tax=Burkholderia sp. MS455 TaxID=2811788 RepID=UPI00195A0A60|nr:transporter substrate-binding domain-containing protein [Burkholderia sp. MS455]